MTTGTDAVWALSAAAGLPLTAYRPKSCCDRRVGRCTRRAATVASSWRGGSASMGRPARGSAGRSPWRLIRCRNVAIYLDAKARRSLNEHLAGALAPGGLVMLGRIEGLAGASHLGLVRIAPHSYRRLA